MTPETAAHPDTTKRFIFHVIKVVLILVVFYFIYLQIKANWENIKTYDWAIGSYGFLVGSLLCALFSLFLFSSCWNMIVRGFGDKLSLPVTFKISYLSNLGRYVPGKVWQLVGIIYVAKQYGLQPEKATASFIVSQLFMTVTAFLILAVSAQIEPGIIVDQIAIMGKGTALLFTLGMITISLVVVIWPNRILGLVNYFLKRISRPTLAFSIDKKVAPLVFLGYCVAWIFYGLAFWMFIKSIVTDTDIGIIPAVGIFAGSYQMGYLVLFAPGGFGPREAVMGQMLMPFLPGVAPIIAILSRIWTTLVEIAATGLSVLIKKNR